MQVGELFVSLGVKGTEKTVQAFTTVKGGLSDMKSMSIETKAALVGAFYAFEQLVAASNNLGTNLANTSALLNMPLKTLQQYNYVAKLVGSSNEEMENTFLSLQQTMAKMNTAGGAPPWLGRIAQVTGVGIDQIKGKRFVEHPEELLQLLQNYAGKETDLNFRNQVLNGFHLSGNLASGLIGQQFNSKNLNAAPVYSDRGVHALDANRKEWTKLGIEIEKAVGDFNIKYGGQLIKDIKEVADSVSKVIHAFMELDKVLPIFKAMDLIAKDLVDTFQVLETLTKAITGDKGERSALSKGILGGPESDYLRPAAQGASSSNNNINIVVNAQGNQNSNSIASKVKQVVTDVFNKNVDSAGRDQLGQGALKPR